MFKNAGLRGAFLGDSERGITGNDHSLAMAWVEQNGESSLINPVISHQRAACAWPRAPSGASSLGRAVLITTPFLLAPG